FEFNQQLWFYMLIDSHYDWSKHDYVECYGRLADDKSHWICYYTAFHGEPHKTKRGAMQIDTCLYFFNYIDNDKISYYQTWWYYTYYYNQSQNRFIATGDSAIINGMQGGTLGGMFSFYDTLNHHYTYINTFNQKGNSYLGFLDSTWQYTPVHGGVYSNCAASAIVQGSIQGKRTTISGHEEDNQRYALFIIGTQKNSDGHYPVTYHELMYELNYNTNEYNGTVVLPASTTPKDVNSQFLIAGTVDLVPKHFTNYLGSDNDGFQQQVWFFYPDSKKKLNGACFNSDLWRPVPNSAVSSNDLANDSLYGKEITTMWSLTGIVDGAPPCSIDWDVWKQHNEVDPTELVFTKTEVSKTELTNAYENEYSMGYEIKTGMGEEGGLGFGTKFKYSNAYLNKVSTGTTITTELTKSFPLNEELQENGVFIYTIPDMTRISYQVYPWWDTQLLDPIPNSLQYLFRTTGTTVKSSTRAIAEFPFLIDKPNATDLADWKPDHRTMHWESIINSGLQPVATMNWSSPTAGDIGTFDEVADTTTSSAQKTTYEVEISAGLKIPAIFEIGLSYGEKTSYESEIQAQTEIGHKVEASLKNLTEKSLGVNFSEYTVEMYWFKPEDGNWWFYDSLAGQKPWYISYIVNYTQGKLVSVTPENEMRLEAPEIFFSWYAEDVEIEEYTLFIASASHIAPSTTVYRKSTLKETASGIPDTVLERDITYYWAVRGITGNKEVLWSESRAFTIQGDPPSTMNGRDLQATIYPNPATPDLIKILALSRNPGPITTEIYALNGQLLVRKTTLQDDTNPVTIEFRSLSLEAGIYVVEIRSETDRIAKKLIINK
ncbi:MAG: T9SS type A sorting domain-containing protein, partial [Bacteroidales bacterium]|nr:T9SS type A sorting domain-containing protein [Bacteroidales bacterium]